MTHGGGAVGRKMPKSVTYYLNGPIDNRRFFKNFSTLTEITFNRRKKIEPNPDRSGHLVDISDFEVRNS